MQTGKMQVLRKKRETSKRPSELLVGDGVQPVGAEQPTSGVRHKEAPNKPKTPRKQDKYYPDATR